MVTHIRIWWLLGYFSIKSLQIIHFRGVLYKTNCADFLFKSKLNNPQSHCSNVMGSVINLGIYLLYACQYDPRLVYSKPTFWGQKRFFVKSGSQKWKYNQAPKPWTNNQLYFSISSVVFAGCFLHNIFQDHCKLKIVGQH